MTGPGSKKLCSFHLYISILKRHLFKKEKKILTVKKHFDAKLHFNIFSRFLSQVSCNSGSRR